MQRQTVTILGATGSIGGSTLDVLSRHPERFEIYALTARRQIGKLADLCRRCGPRYAVVESEHVEDVFAEDRELERLIFRVLRDELLEAARSDDTTVEEPVPV